MPKTIEQTLNSREVAEMVEKEHKELLRDIRRYIAQLGEAKIGFTDFFTESTYHTEQNKVMPCYQITKKGCEFIAHKLTGTKGTIFTAKYINRFHEMQDILSEQEKEPELPWFIRRFRGKYIMLFRDFKSLTGIELFGNYTSHKRLYRLIGGIDHNGWGWKCNNEKFKAEYGFDYGDDPCMMYLYPCGIQKALDIMSADRKTKTITGSHEIIKKGLDVIRPKKKEICQVKTVSENIIQDKQPIQISIILGDSTKTISIQ